MKTSLKRNEAKLVFRESGYLTNDLSVIPRSLLKDALLTMSVDKVSSRKQEFRKADALFMT